MKDGSSGSEIQYDKAQVSKDEPSKMKVEEWNEPESTLDYFRETTPKAHECSQTKVPEAI